MALDAVTSAVDSQVAVSHTACYLDANTLACFEVACQGLRRSIFQRQVWAEYFRQALPSFELSPSLLKARSHDDRRKAKLALGRLVNLRLPLAAPIRLTSLATANRLGNALRSATSLVEEHHSSGGGLAVASALLFRFPDAERIGRGPQALGHWDASRTGATRPEDWVVSKPEWIRAPTIVLIESSAGDVQKSSSFFEIQVRLAYLNTMTLISALACIPDEFADSEIVFDLACLEPDFLLHTRDLSLRLNGEWTELKGLRSQSPSPKRLSAAMASGLTCVLSFRDIVDSNHPRVLKITPALSALNLQSLRLRPQ